MSYSSGHETSDLRTFALKGRTQTARSWSALLGRRKSFIFGPWVSLMLYREGKQRSPMEVVVMSPGFYYRSFGNHVGRHTEKRETGWNRKNELPERATTNTI
jgi:hypothetical protein